MVENKTTERSAVEQYVIDLVSVYGKPFICTFAVTPKMEEKKIDVDLLESKSMG